MDSILAGKIYTLNKQTQFILSVNIFFKPTLSLLKFDFETFFGGKDLFFFTLRLDF